MKVVYYDGYCGVCVRFVSFLLRHTRDVKFATLQGHTAEERLPRELADRQDTMVFEENGRAYTESSAAIRSLAQVVPLFKIFLLVPKPLRDGVYRWVASHRYWWKGQLGIATSDERDRFLS